MLLLDCFAHVLFALQFIFLHAYTGAVVKAVGAARNYFFYRTRPCRKNAWVLCTFLTATLAATALTWQGAISLLPLCGNWLNTTANWQARTRWFRRIAAFAPPFWILYSLIVHSYAGIFIETFILCSNLLGQYRFDMKPFLADKRSAESQLQ